MTSVPIDDYYRLFQGKSVLAGWDVMVSYSEEQLNNMIRKTWTQSKDIDISFSIPYPMFNDNIAYALRLGSPMLSFDTENEGWANLVMPIHGSYTREKTGHKCSINPGAYALSVRVPIATVDGEQSLHQDHKRIIRFDENTEKSYYLVFHFNNTEAKWTLNCLDPKLRADSVLQPALKGIQAWFEDKGHISSIEYRIAELSNKTNPNSDFLRPLSFCFSTQRGCLNVFIQTKGSGSAPGSRPPESDDYKTKDIMPVPEGSDASIIISRRVIQDLILIPGIKEACRDCISVKEGEAISGIQLHLYLNSKTVYDENTESGFGWYKTSQRVEVDFAKKPLVLNIAGEPSRLGLNASWEYNLKMNIPWRGYGGTAYSGHYTVEATIPSVSRDFARIKNGSLKCRFPFFQSDEPRMSFSGGVPWVLQYAVGLYPFQFRLPPLDLSPTQRVFGLKDHIFQVSHVTIPYDLVIAGKMYPHDSKDVVEDQPDSPDEIQDDNKGKDHTIYIPGLPPIRIPWLDEIRPAFAPLQAVTKDYFSAAKESTPLSAYLAPPIVDSRTKMLKLLDELHVNQRLSENMWKSIVDDDGKGFLDVVQQAGLELKTGDLSALMELLVDMSRPGPDFDIRSAGGVYRITTEDSLNWSELMVHPVERKIFLDGTEVDNQEQNVDGHITFSIENGQQYFDITFDCPFDPNSTQNYLNHSFSGKTWSSHSEQDISAIDGQKYFPYDLVDDTSVDWEESSIGSIQAEKTREREARKYLAVAMTLASAAKPASGKDGNVDLQDSPPATDESVDTMALTSELTSNTVSSMAKMEDIPQNLLVNSAAVAGVVGVASILGAGYVIAAGGSGLAAQGLIILAKLRHGQIMKNASKTVENIVMSLRTELPRNNVKAKIEEFTLKAIGETSNQRALSPHPDIEKTVDKVNESMSAYILESVRAQIIWGVYKEFFWSKHFKGFKEILQEAVQRKFETQIRSSAFDALVRSSVRLVMGNMESTDFPERLEEIQREIEKREAERSTKTQEELERENETYEKWKKGVESRKEGIASRQQEWPAEKDFLERKSEAVTEEWETGIEKDINDRREEASRKERERLERIEKNNQRKLERQKEKERQKQERKERQRQQERERQARRENQ